MDGASPLSTTRKRGLVTTLAATVVTDLLAPARAGGGLQHSHGLGFAQGPLALLARRRAPALALRLRPWRWSKCVDTVRNTAWCSPGIDGGGPFEGAVGHSLRRCALMLNRIILIGRLTRDPELRYTPAGNPVATFTLAVDRPFRRAQGEREADFIPIVAWRKTWGNGVAICGQGPPGGGRGAVASP